MTTTYQHVNNNNINNDDDDDNNTNNNSNNNKTSTTAANKPQRERGFLQCSPDDRSLALFTLPASAHSSYRFS